MQRIVLTTTILFSMLAAAPNGNNDKGNAQAQGSAYFSDMLQNAPDYLYYDGRCNCFREMGRSLDHSGDQSAPGLNSNESSQPD